MANDYNPAQRLHDLISAGPSTDGDKVNAIEVFATILGAPEDDGSELLSRISKMLLLPKQIKAAVKAIEGINHERYLSWYQKAETGIRELNLRANWKTFYNSFPPESMTTLGFCADLLSEHLPEKNIETNKLDELVVRIDEMLSELENIELPSTDWYFIFHHLTQIRDALTQYRVTGLRGVEDAYAQAIGAIVLNPVSRQRLRDKPIWKTFYGVLQGTALILSIYGGASQLNHDISGLIGLDDSTDDAKNSNSEVSATSDTEPN